MWLEFGLQIDEMGGSPFLRNWRTFREGYRNSEFLRVAYIREGGGEAFSQILWYRWRFTKWEITKTWIQTTIRNSDHIFIAIAHFLRLEKKRWYKFHTFLVLAAAIVSPQDFADCSIIWSKSRYWLKPRLQQSSISQSILWSLLVLRF